MATSRPEVIAEMLGQGQAQPAGFIQPPLTAGSAVTNLATRKSLRGQVWQQPIENSVCGLLIAFSPRLLAWFS